MVVAFQEVEDSLALERYQIQRIERLQAQVEFAQKASERLLNRKAFVGDIDYLDVLSTVQAEQRLQRETLSARLDLIFIRIGLYLALAGDFEPCPQSDIALPTDVADAAISPSTESADLNDVESPIEPRLPFDLPQPTGPARRLQPVEPVIEIDLDG